MDCFSNEQLEQFRQDCNEFWLAEKVKNQHIQDGIAYTQVYSSMVAILVQEYTVKGWGQVDEKAMEGIIEKARAVAKLHHRVASAAV